MEPFMAYPALLMGLLETYALPIEGRSSKTQAVAKDLEKFGLVERGEVTSRGKAYVTALTKVPLPVRAWVDANGVVLGVTIDLAVPEVK